MFNKLTLAATIIAIPVSSFAAEQIPVFKASAELGALYKTGNNRSADLKAGLDLNYDIGLWRNVFAFDLLVKQTEQTNNVGDKHLQTSDNKWLINAQTNYTIDPNKRNYVYGNISYENNHFGNFETQTSISSGWGRRWIDTKQATFDAEIGPGYKQDVTRANELIPSKKHNTLIVQSQGTYVRKLNEYVELRQVLTAKIAVKSGENSKFKAETSVTTKLIETLQLKFSFIIEHNTDVDVKRKNTDTETAVTLVYSF
jgi:putative salt-induced outer membrane protein